MKLFTKLKIGMDERKEKGEYTNLQLMDIDLFHWFILNKQLNPISHNQMDLFEWSCLPSHLLNSSYLSLLKVRHSGISLPLFSDLVDEVQKRYTLVLQYLREFFCGLFYIFLTSRD